MSLTQRADHQGRDSSRSRIAVKHDASFFDDFPAVTPSPGTVLVRTRAISARVNKNFDGFPSQELKEAHQTFVGRPVFVNHNNLNHRQTRGIIKGAVYKEEAHDKHVDLLIEVDARAFPRLAAEIEAGRLDGVSMGTDVQRTICSYCDNVAKDPYEFCSHILYHKGSVLERVSANFQRESVLVYERCEGLNFFEISFVFDPADETALVQEVYVPGGYYSSAPVDDSSVFEFSVVPKIAYDDTVAPSDVDTLRQQQECPQCGDSNYDGEECLWCGYNAPPEELADPDLEKAKQTDLRQEMDQSLLPQQPQQLTMAARRDLSANPFVRRS